MLLVRNPLDSSPLMLSHALSALANMQLGPLQLVEMPCALYDQQGCFLCDAAGADNACKQCNPTGQVGQ